MWYTLGQLESESKILFNHPTGDGEAGIITMVIRDDVFFCVVLLWYV